MVHETLNVTGMHCPNCTDRVEKALGALAGVEHAKADFGLDTVEVSYDGAPETLDAVKAAIVDEGFVVES